MPLEYCRKCYSNVRFVDGKNIPVNCAYPDDGTCPVEIYEEQRKLRRVTVTMCPRLHCDEIGLYLLGLLVFSVGVIMMIFGEK